MEELWRNNNRGRTQGFLLWERGKTRALSWISCSQGHRGAVMGCRPVSRRFITIRLRAAPFNITIVQVYTSTSDYDDNEIEEFYDQLQNVMD